MDSLKTWLLEVGAKKLLPSLIRAALASFTGLLIAHADLLQKIGIAYDPATNSIMIQLNTLDVWLVSVGLGVIAAFFAATQHHVTAAVTGAPQSGALNPQ